MIIKSNATINHYRDRARIVGVTTATVSRDYMG